MTQTFRALNFKGVVEMEAQPDGSLLVVGGKNGQGKSSFIDAISELFDPKGARLTPKPIREGADGETIAEFVDDELDVRIVRKWKKDDSGTLEVWTLDGAKRGKPGEYVRALTGGVVFDPSEFVGLAEKDQRSRLLRVVDLPFDLEDMLSRRAGRIETRRDANAYVKRLATRLAAHEVPAEDAPTEEVSAGDIFEQIQAVHSENQKIEEARAAVIARDAERERVEDEIEAIAKRMAELAEKSEALAASIPPETLALSCVERATTDALEEQLAEVDAVNSKVREAQAWRQLKSELEVAEASAAAEQTALDAIDQKMADGLSAAVWPVPGLSVTDAEVTLHGVPFRQVNTSMQNEVAFMIATHGDADLRIVICKNGDVFDGAAVERIRAIAEERDFTVLMERGRPDYDSDVRVLTVVEGRFAA